MDYPTLICVLEYIIAKHCYGKNFHGGMYYRYPIRFEENGTEYIARGDGRANVPQESLSSMYYEFGANRLYIGKALLEIMAFLQSTFGNFLKRKDRFPLIGPWFFGPFAMFDIEKRGYSKLLCRLEYMIAKCCYNKPFNSGMYYRYPICFEENGTEYIVKGEGVAKVPQESLSSMYYEFGTNRLYIGEALLEVIDFLESQFNVRFWTPEDDDFNEDDWFFDEDD